jgi:uncharacterized membrane protein YqaE (UPF0057 family)
MVKASDVLIIIVAIVFPPAAVAIMTGCSGDLLINIVLTLLGYFPGHIHAFWLIYRKIKAENLYGHGGIVYTGNGQYQPLQTNPEGQAPYYGATHTT